MAKRTDLKHSILKQVIFRIDYSNIMDNDVENVISNSLRSLYFQNGFEKFWNEYENSVDINLPNSNRNDDVPQFNNFERINLWCFYGEDEYLKKTIKLSRNYFYLSLSVKTKYTSFIDYIDIINHTMTKIKERVTELRYTKISMRKINSCIINNLDNVSKYFNEKVFNIENEVLKYDVNDFNALTNSVILKRNDINVNYIRNLQKGTNALKNEVLYQIVLDLNSYINDINTINDYSERNELTNLITNINTELYNVYIEGLTNLFIEKLQNDTFNERDVRLVN